MSRNTFQKIDSFYNEVRNWHVANEDSIAQARAMQFDQPYSLSFQSEEADVGNLFGSFAEAKTAYEAALNDHAFGQISQRLDIPASWAINPERCPDELREQIFRYKFEHADPDQNFLVRMRHSDQGNIARAVLSDQYTPFDHVELADALKDAVEQSGLDVEVWRPDIGDEMRGYLLIKGIDFGAGGNGNGNPPRGDGGGSGGTKPAIYFSNSEIGTGKLRINGGLYRGYCSNGLILGWKMQNSVAITHRWRTRAMLHIMANEAIAVAMRMSEKAAKTFLNSRMRLVQPTKLKDIVNSWASKYGITVDSKQSWLTLCQNQINHDDRISKFDLINHASDVAGGVSNPAERETMEVMAGDMVFDDFSRYVVSR